MYTSRCVFLDGVEVYRSPDCPHERTEDELGQIIDPGWTVQQGDPKGPNDRG